MYWSVAVKTCLRAAFAAVLLGTAGIASAGAIVSQVGDKDGFGIGVLAGDVFDPFDVQFGSPDGDGTDEWVDGGLSVQHVYSLTGNILSASLEVFSGGWGRFASAEVRLNGLRIGDLTAGQTSTVDGIANLDPFDLTPYIALLTGNDTIHIVPMGTTDLAGDDGVLDYSLLTIVTDPSGTVPEPTSWALTALALAGLAASRRRQAR